MKWFSTGAGRWVRRGVTSNDFREVASEAERHEPAGLLAGEVDAGGVDLRSGGGEREAVMICYGGCAFRIREHYQEDAKKKKKNGWWRVRECGDAGARAL